MKELAALTELGWGCVLGESAGRNCSDSRIRRSTKVLRFGGNATNGPIVTKVFLPEWLLKLSGDFLPYLKMSL